MIREILCFSGPPPQDTRSQTCPYVTHALIVEPYQSLIERRRPIISKVETHSPWTLETEKKIQSLGYHCNLISPILWATEGDKPQLKNIIPHSKIHGRTWRMTYQFKIANHARPQIPTLTRVVVIDYGMTVRAAILAAMELGRGLPYTHARQVNHSGKNVCRLPISSRTRRREWSRREYKDTPPCHEQWHACTNAHAHLQLHFLREPPARTH